MAAVRYLGFVKFNFLTVGEVKRPILHQRTKFRKSINQAFIAGSMAHKNTHKKSVKKIGQSLRTNFLVNGQGVWILWGSKIALSH